VGAKRWLCGWNMAGRESDEEEGITFIWQPTLCMLLHARQGAMGE
jgi:hypothetical protein